MIERNKEVKGEKTISGFQWVVLFFFFLELKTRKNQPDSTCMFCYDDKKKNLKKKKNNFIE